LAVWAEKSVAYIDERAKQPEQPFFLYLPLTSPHTPIVPSEEWQGKSSIGAYGDFLMETDWVVEQVLEALDKHGLTENTLVVFTTDNGCSPAAKIPALEEKGHKPNGDLRGHKADIYEGGHRVPFIVRWPGKVGAGTVTARLTCQTDFTATCAEVLGVKLAPNAGVDSVSFLKTLSDPKVVERSAVVHHSIDGAFAIREGNWKLCLCKGSGGWSNPRPRKAPKDAPAVQLFDLEADPAEQKNLAVEMPEKVAELTALLQGYVDEGRSTPGPRQKNVGKVNIGPLE
jgi:arylsulfatase A-like enzyme